jgi:hypothetical protein
MDQPRFGNLDPRDGNGGATPRRGPALFDNAQIVIDAARTFLVRLDKHALLDAGQKFPWQLSLQLVAGVDDQAGVHVAPVFLEIGVHAGKWARHVSLSGNSLAFPQFYQPREVFAVS